ncbi:MAG: divalent-cation tolerance protein CutA [Deltaproteobacteria bacterium]|nr:divalent-cation tolerance protein CutA [Deltaproteobacteria bacterium]
MTDFIQVFITVNSLKKAREIAGALIKTRLAACVQISGPITSMYKWQGKITEDQEWLIIAKSDRARFNDLSNEVKQIHPYEVPEILALPVIEGNSSYLNWLKEELT